MDGSKLNSKEQERAAILKSAIMGKITNAQAAKQLRLLVRQVQRAKANVRKGGDNTVIHRLKGKISNHAFPEDVKAKAVETIKNKYDDFQPGFATEKLQTIHDMHMTSQTIRTWMTEAGIWKTRKQKNIAIHRSWRPRKEYFGEMQQFDGSYHYWFENRLLDTNGDPIEVCLLASIDDATGQITKAVFAANEGVHAVFTFWKEYVQELGKTLAIYLDKFSTYKINHKAAVDNFDLMTQFERAMQDLNIYLISAHSPQAKGRIERLFGTLQDRLVKEMRLAHISTMEEGNKFLKEVFIPKFNQQFSVIPAKTGTVHKQLTDIEQKQLDHIFSIHETRRINLDFTIQFKNNWYQLTEIQPTTVRPLEKVLIETWLDQTVHIILKNHELAYTLLPEKLKKQQTKQPIILTTHKLSWKPPANHPWRTPRG